MSEEVKDFNEDEIVEETKEVENEEVSAIEVIEKLNLENAKLKEDYLRAYAEGENIRKRSQIEIDKANKFAITSFAKELLVVADNLDRAILSISEKEEDNIKTIIEGIEMTQKQLNAVFEKFDIKKLSSLGEVFDPNFHQVIQQVEDKEKVEGTIISELQTGYVIKDRVLREAYVVVSTGGEKPAKKEDKK